MTLFCTHKHTRTYYLVFSSHLLCNVWLLKLHTIFYKNFIFLNFFLFLLTPTISYTFLNLKIFTFLHLNKLSLFICYFFAFPLVHHIHFWCFSCQVNRTFHYTDHSTAYTFSFYNLIQILVVFVSTFQLYTLSLFTFYIFSLQIPSYQSSKS